MSSVSKIKNDGVLYDIEDSTARADISDLKNEISSLSAIPIEVKRAMDTLFSNAMYINGETYTEEISAIHEWATSVKLLSISAVFDQGENVIYNTDSLEDLKQYLTVTANYDDGTSGTVSNYTLSGTLEEGTSTIAVTYNGKTATFTVDVTGWDIEWDYTDGIPSENDGWNVGGTGSITLETDGVLLRNTDRGQTSYIARSVDYTAIHGIAEIELTPIVSTNDYQGVFISFSTGTVGCRLRIYNSILYYGALANTQATDTSIANLTLNRKYKINVEYSASQIIVKLDGNVIHTETNPSATPSRFVLNNTTAYGSSVKVHSIRLGDVA